MSDIIGWIGAVSFAVCAIPQAYTCYKTKSARGLSMSFLLLWTIGEICLLYYSFMEVFSYQLIFNYVFNLTCLAIIFYYKFKDHRRDKVFEQMVRLGEELGLYDEPEKNEE